MYSGGFVMKKLKYTKKGTISYSLALIQIAYMIIIAIVDISGNYMLYYTNTYILFETIVRTVVAIIGLSLGLISLFQKESKRVRPIIGIIISAFVLIGPILGIFKAITILL
jgi:hypothetical protein